MSTMERAMIKRGVQFKLAKARFNEAVIEWIANQKSIPKDCPRIMGTFIVHLDESVIKGNDNLPERLLLLSLFRQSI